MSNTTGTGGSTNQAMADAAEKDKEKFGKYYPTIFVSVGGTGAKVFERIRRHTLERFGGLGAKYLPGVAYVSIDTDTGSALAGHQQDNTRVGQGINQLLNFRTEERLTLAGERIRHHVENQAALNGQPHIAEWFDPLLMETAKGMEISKGAGQIRPVARLVAWENRAEIVALFDRAYNEVISLSDDAYRRVIGGSGVNVILCGSFAGGTGAGTFLDVAAMIRDAKPEVSITGMFVLPEVFSVRNPDPKPKANGYACLAELNYYSTEPFRVRWTANSKPKEIPVLFDRVYVFDRYNESEKGITQDSDIYDTIGDALFLDFFQGPFYSTRDSIQVNRTQTLLQIHKNRRNIQPFRWARQNGNVPIITSVEMESYRQRLISMGLSRVAVPSWRILNRMSYDLARQLIDFLDNQANLLADEDKLKREFASKLGFFQGEMVLDGMTQRVYQVQSALSLLPSEGNAQATMSEAINLRFNDLTHPDAVALMWKEKNCGSELRRLWDAIGKDFAGLDDDGHKGTYIERITTNRRVLFSNIVQNLEDVIDAFCERSDVGPHRIAQVMRRLIGDIRNSQVFWIKEMEQRAEEQATVAETYKNDWKRWSSLAVEADTNMRILGLGQEAFKAQLKNAQDAGRAYWNALAARKVYLESAASLRDIARHLEKEGVERQELLAMRLNEMRNSFAAFTEEYARARKSPVFNEFDVDDASGVAELRALYLGETADKQQASLRTLFERTKSHLGIRSNRELRERIEADREKFIRDFRNCCWLALRGTEGKTDWFGTPQRGFIESQSVLDYLLKRYGSANNPQFVEMVKETFKKSRPWVKLYDGIKLEGVVRDCYVIIPATTPQNRSIADEFYKIIQAESAAVSGISIQRVMGTDQSEISVIIETSGLIPASISTLHGQSGMYESYRQLIATRRQQNIKSFLHIDRDVVRFPPLIPIKASDSDKLVAAWKLFLLGVMLGVVRTKRNPVRVDPMEQSLFPIFMYTYDSPGITEVVELGQWQSAINDIADNSNLQQRLTEMVNRQYAQQPASRYERILALVHYYKYCIFPVKKARPDEGQDQTPRATLAYLALLEIEQEVLTQWQRPNPATDEQVKELLAHKVPELLWGIEQFALHVGQEDPGAGLCRGLEDDEYVEQPPAHEHAGEQTEVARRRELRDIAYNLLPLAMQSNPALRERSQYYPWLRLAPRYRLYIPSAFLWESPNPTHPSHINKLQEFSVREAATFLLAHPEDSNERWGARLWHHPAGRPRGEYVEWSRVHGLKDEYLRKDGIIDTNPAPPNAAIAPPNLAPPTQGIPPLPSMASATESVYAAAGGPPPTDLTVAEIVARIQALPTGQHFLLIQNAWTDATSHPDIRSQLAPQPKPGTLFYYVGPTSPQPSQLDVSAIAAHIKANPTGNHLVVVNQAWINPTTVDEIQAALTPSLPPLPGVPKLPPLPGALPALPNVVVLPPIPPGPFHYTGAGYTNWTSLSGEQLVTLVLAQPAGAEGHVVYNNAATGVMSVPELATAINARRQR